MAPARRPISTSPTHGLHAAIACRDRRAGRRDAARSFVQHDRRGFEETASGVGLDVGKEFVVGGEAVEDFGVDVGLDFGETLPAAVIHDGADEPNNYADDGAKDQKHREALKDVAPYLDHGALALWAVEAAVGGVSVVEGGIAGDLGMGVEEGPEGRIGRQVGLIAE